MTTPIFNMERLQVLDLLPTDWLKRIEKKFQGIPSTVYPDEATILAGTDKECIVVLKEYDLYSDAIELLMTEKGEI